MATTELSIQKSTVTTLEQLVGMSYPKSTEFRGNPQAINLGKQAEEQDRAHRQRNMGECNTIYVPPLEEDEMQYSPKMDLI